MTQDAYNQISTLLDQIGDQLDNIPYSALSEADAGPLTKVLEHVRKAEAALAPVARRYGDWDPE